MKVRGNSHRSEKSFAASHQRSWLRGRYAVMETLKAGRWPVMELFGADDLTDAVHSELQALALQAGVSLQIVSSARLTQLCGQNDHQGYLARMASFPCGSLHDLEVAAGSRLHSEHHTQDLVGESGDTTVLSATPQMTETTRCDPLYVVCDRIQDAHNFGAILRCCDAMQADGIVIGESAQVNVTPHVARASAGAVNHLNLYRVPHLTAAIDSLRDHGYRVVAASEKSATTLWETPMTCPMVVIIGSEAHGISAELTDRCDAVIGIPMLGSVSSLNAAVAAGIILYELRRQQHSARR